jgi:hypothetical protein
LEQSSEAFHNCSKTAGTPHSQTPMLCARSTAVWRGGLLHSVSGVSYWTLRAGIVGHLRSYAHNGRILLANLFQGSRSTLFCVSFPSVFAFHTGMWGTPISALLNSPTVTHEPWLSTAYGNGGAISSRVSGRFSFCYDHGRLRVPVCGQHPPVTGGTHRRPPYSSSSSVSRKLGTKVSRKYRTSGSPRASTLARSAFSAFANSGLPAPRSSRHLR